MARSIPEVRTLLVNIYYNGLEHRAGARIERATLRGLFEMGRLESGTLVKLRDELRAHGFLFAPLDSADYSRAGVWLIERVARLEEWPLADESVVRTATARAETIGA